MIKPWCIYLKEHNLAVKGRNYWSSCHNVNKSQKHFALGKKTDTKGCIFYDSSYIIFQKRQTYKGEKSDQWSQGWVKDVDCNRTSRIWRDMKIFYILMWWWLKDYIEIQNYILRALRNKKSWNHKNPRRKNMQ